MIRDFLPHAAPDTTHAPLDPESPAPIRSSRLRAAVQIIGFLVGLALLAWCIQRALKPDSLKQWANLRDAAAADVALLVALSVATMLVNGAIFWLAARPVKKLGGIDVQAVNAVGSMLAYLPFKLSVLFRMLVHNRRDGMPLLTIAAWFAAVAASAAAGVLPPIGATLLRGRADGGWWMLTGAGVALATAAIIIAAYLLHDGPGWAWFEKLWRAVRLPAGLLPRAHEGLRMLAHARIFSGCVALRLLDAAIHSARFLIAARILGFDLPVDKAVIAGCAFFLVGAAAPSGTLGLREALTGGLLGRLLTGVDPDRFMVAVLVVSLIETLALIPAAVAGVAWIKPWRLKRKEGAASHPDTPAIARLP